MPASQNEHSHYVCTDNGEVKCLRGWTGDVCDVPICRKGCDPLQGYCKRPGECLCKLGMVATDVYISLWQIHHPLNTLMHVHVDFSIYKEIHSFSSLSYDRSKASSKASSPHSAIQSFLFQMRVSSPFLGVIQ